MGDAGAATSKARGEVDNVVDEVVRTIQDGVTHPDGTDGFDPGEAERLRATLVEFARHIVRAARGENADLDGAIDQVVQTIGRGVIPSTHGGFGTRQSDELRSRFRMFADAIVAAARTGPRTRVDPAIDPLVRTLRIGLFRVYGRASYAAITADQLTAYFETFVDTVLAVVEREG